MNLNITKQSIRKKFLKKRDRLNKNFSEELKKNFINNFLNHTKISSSKIVGGYYPIGSEIDCLKILKLSQEKGATTAIPYIKEDNIIEFRKWRNGEPLIEGMFNIPTPKEEKIVIPDIILVPLVVFDDTGTRIGFGSGIYDRSLPFFSDSKKIGLAFFDQLNKKRLPKEEFDYPLDAVITEKRVFIFDEEDKN